VTINSLDVLRQRSLVAVPRKLHGLGNRVRVVLGSRSLARLEDRRFFYAWHTGTDFGARFDELWEISERVVPMTTARALSLKYPFRDEKLEWLTATRNERVVQIRTPHALHLPSNATSWEQEFQALQPVETIRTRVHSFFDAHLSGQPYIGVMVRAHPRSHAATLTESPIEWYLQRMREIRADHPEIPFFVSADTRETQQRVTESISGAHALDDKGEYNTRSGLQSSVADLYLLAASSHLLAPHFSSFPEMAQKLAGPVLRLETSQTTPATRFSPGDPLQVVEDPTNPHFRRSA